MSIEHVTFSVEGLLDETRMVAVREALIRLNGVVEVLVDGMMRRVAVEYDAERMEYATLKGTLEDAGYKVR